MITDDLRSYIKSHLDLLPVEQTLQPSDAECRAARLLVATAFLADYRHSMLAAKIAANSEAISTYSKVMNTTEFGPKVTVTEKKSLTEANPDYLKSQESVDVFENNAKYLSTIIEVFNNGHLLLRQIAKGTL